MHLFVPRTRAKADLTITSILRQYCESLPMRSIFAKKLELPANGVQVLRYTRRTFIGATVPGILGAGATAASVYDVTLKDGRADLRRGDTTVWSVDPSRFSGRAIVSVRRDGPQLQIELCGACFPGTQLSADFECTISPGFTGWRIDFRKILGREALSVPLESWLSNSIPCRFTVLLPEEVLGRDRVGEIRISGEVRAEFYANWRYQFKGAGIEARFDGHRLPSESATLRLPLYASEPSFLASSAPVRRSLITLARGSQKWDFVLPATGPAGSRIESSPEPFEAIHVESGECDGHTVRCFVAEAGRHAVFRFYPGVEYLARSGSPASLPLRDARYAIGGEGLPGEKAFFARFGDPVWMNARGIGLQLGNGANTEQFTLIRDEHGALEIGCAPALHAIHVPIEGAVADAQIQPGTNLTFFADPAAFTQAQSGILLGPKATVQVPAGTLQILRHQDLLSLGFQFFNLAFHPGKRRNIFEWITLRKPHPPVLRRPPVVPGASPRDAFIVVGFPPQHVSEKAVFEDASLSTAVLPTQPVAAKFSGESRLAFKVPVTIESIELTLEKLLDWGAFEPSVAPTATARGESTTEPIREPTSTETALELPSRLLLSPSPYSAWAHSINPASNCDTSRKITWTELWHTRLAVRVPGQTGADEQNSFHRTLRAIYALDPGGLKTPPPACQPGQDPPSNAGGADGLDAMNERDRFEIVHLTSNFNGLKAGETGEPIDPDPIQVERLFLTSQGAWLASQGDWQPADVALTKDAAGHDILEGISIREWRQETTGGRDHHVRIVYGGFLFPYGHRANLVQITERRFQRRDRSSPIKAYLRQRIFITVEDPFMEYGDAGLDAQGISIDRQMPFTTIECTTLSTPNLDRPAASDLKYPCYFWPRVLARFFQFHFKGTDAAGHITEFTSPCIFFEYGQRRNGVAIAEVKKAFEDSGEQRRSFSGQKLAFAPEREAGDATMQADFVHFSAYPDPEPVPTAALSPVFSETRGSGSTNETAEFSTLGIPRVPISLAFAAVTNPNGGRHARLGRRMFPRQKLRFQRFRDYPVPPMRISRFPSNGIRNISRTDLQSTPDRPTSVKYSQA